ncbi:HisA/HisF-related TIM barrel protein [Geminicoccaceae bacterium 1502E]|nr:HisA/HisF-related TIM barrel protein [Geminicoccaceae bacterium 1502E]
MAAFEVIPVIDLMNGQVVHARAGDRATYRPLEGSTLCASAEPLEVVRGLLRLHPFRTLYIADLDAIQKRGDHKPLIRRLRTEFPALDLWVDAGFAGLCDCRAYLKAGLGALVLGTESQSGLATVTALREEPQLVLSLDFRGEQLLGPRALFDQVELWPGRVIAMTLARVGAGRGPDRERLAQLKAAGAGRRIFAAGGVRDEADLAALAADGCAGALIASCLHSGRVGAEALERLAGPA